MKYLNKIINFAREETYLTFPITFPMFICTLSFVKLIANSTKVSHAALLAVEVVPFSAIEVNITTKPDILKILHILTY